MRLYLHIMLNAMQTTTTYRFHTFISTINRVIGIFVQVSLWTALYKGASVMDIDIPHASLQQMLVYILFSSIVAICVANQNIYTLSEKIQTGDIVINFVRPIGLFRSMLFECMGNRSVGILFEIVPILLLGLFILQIPVPDMITLLQFFLALINGFLVCFLLTYLVGLCSFWYIRTFHLDFIVNSVVNLLSGVMIPLWFFPKIFRDISTYLPFDLIYFHPISIIVQQPTGGMFGWILLKGYIWIVLLALAILLVWRKGRNKLIIQGG